MTLQIMWVTANTPIPCTAEQDAVRACYVVDTHTIYLDKNLKGFYRYFVPYHEIAHSLYKENFDKTLFKDTIFSKDYETIANDFAWWMYAKKFPKEQKFVNQILTKEKIQYFKDTCDKQCVKYILGLPIKK